jgi:hypothetical protein
MHKTTDGALTFWAYQYIKPMSRKVHLEIPSLDETVEERRKEIRKERTNKKKYKRREGKSLPRD